MKVDKSMTIHEAIGVSEDIIPILLNSGMHCLGCPSAQGESLEEACMVHGIDVDGLVNEINSFLESK